MMKFDDWFDEQVGYTIRCEWFFDDLEEHFRAGNKSAKMVEWLKAAYEEGYNQARYDTMKLYWDDGK